MFDIGLGEFLVLGVLALLVFGPDRLPSVASTAGKWVSQLKASIASAREQLGESAELDGMNRDLQSIADLHPRRIAQSLTEPPAPAPTRDRGQPVADGQPEIDPNAT